MAATLRDFLGEYQRGIEVCVAGTSADQLLGVREAFRRFFHDALGKPAPVAVVPQETAPDYHGLSGSDPEAEACARRSARALEARLPGTYHFYVAHEGCVHPVETDDGTRWFVRVWTAVVGPAGESVGSSGSIQIPQHLIEGLSGDQLPHEVPGRRRAGGTIASLTGGLETRRSAVAASTLHALSTLFYGILDRRPGAAG
jgi:non-canonical (house-cleaning) NTP pyrophosphatase